MEKRRKISIIIPAFNAAELIEEAIRSVKWADEILVVDSFSTDNTVQIARDLGAKVIQHEYVYSAKQKNWAIPQATHDWILLLDTDEVVTEKLSKNILKLLASKKMDKYDGFGIARKHYFFGKFLRWGGRYPLYNIRLFKKTCRYEDRDVHAHIILDKEKMSYVKGDMLHFSDRNIEQFMEKFNRYSTYQANYMKKIADRHIKIDWMNFFLNGIYFKSIIKDVWHFIPGASFLRFFYMYVMRLGFLDGKQGLVIALFYGLQDYVAKTKYIESRDHKAETRKRLQNALIRKLRYQFI